VEVPNTEETTMDTRKWDLIELAQSRKKAKNAFERDMVDRAVSRIMRESGAVRERREKLVMAMRNNDKRAINRFQHDLFTMRMNETEGRG
jgi:RNase P protein component